MSAQAPNRQLPDRPSKEHLKKEAKRFAKERGLKLAQAQRTLAHEYGFQNWAALMREVEARALPPLVTAAARADAEQVRTLLAEGANVEGDRKSYDYSPLYAVCDSTAPAEQRLAVARMLLDAGAFPRHGNGPRGVLPLCVAAKRGPAALVEMLLRAGALVWHADLDGKHAYDYALEGSPIDKEQILFMLKDGPKISDPNFADAVTAIQGGDLEGLKRLLDAHPSLLRERATEPDYGSKGYFSDPKLFWFVANNPTLTPHSPPNIVAITQEMISRGVEQEDLDYAFGLVATNSMLPRPLQLALTRVLIDAGAQPGDMLFSLGHRQIIPSVWLVDNGRLKLTAAIAAGLGRADDLPALLAQASQKEKNDALAMAVINRQFETMRMSLEAGADPNAFMPCHTHSTAVHQAAINDDIPALEVLIAHGGDLRKQDTLWRGIPVGWAHHGGAKRAEAYLRKVMNLPLE